MWRRQAPPLLMVVNLTMHHHRPWEASDLYERGWGAMWKIIMHMLVSPRVNGVFNIYLCYLLSSKLCSLIQLWYWSLICYVQLNNFLSFLYSWEHISGSSKIYLINFPWNYYHKKMYVLERFLLSYSSFLRLVRFCTCEICV